MRQSLEGVPAFAGVVLALIGVAVYGWTNGGRRIRVGLSALVGVTAAVVLLIALTLGMHREASPEWVEFSIGPASGESLSIQPTAMRGNGVTLKAAIALAYDMPPVRVIGPPWLASTRYSINAAAGLDQSESLSSLLRHELENRLRLETHVEVRPFDVFVLAATPAPRLERSQRKGPSIWVRERDAQLRGASMAALASALQSVVAAPVIDETGITGSYDLDLRWGDNRAESVTATLADRFGLRLSPGKRDMEALIVDHIRRDAELVLLAHAGRVTRRAPAQVRQRIADILTIR